jgi:hypothetical protein
MIVCAIVLFLVTSAILFVRWAKMTEPTSVLVIDASPAWRDAKIKVDGVTLIGGALTATIGSDDRYSIPFFLDPGEYTVEVTLNDELQYQRKIRLQRQMMAKIDLRSEHPTTAESPASPPNPF